MNAFLQILRQLFEAVTPESWKAQAFFPLALGPGDRSRLHDLVVFHQTAREAYGIAWIDFKHFDKLIIFPFCMVRYRTDEALISLAPWSLRDARADETFYHHMRGTLRKNNPLITMRGNLLSTKAHSGDPTVTAVSIDQDSSHLLVRVDALEAYKVFRTTARENPVSSEIDMMEYLSNSADFKGVARLISSLEYTTTSGTTHCVAISMNYVQSRGTLWNQMLVLLQDARYPRWSQMGKEVAHWYKCLELIQKAGRLVADFHRSMMKAKKPATIVPVSLDAVQILNWKDQFKYYISDMIDKTDDVQQKFNSYHQVFFRKIRPLSERIFKELASIESVGLLVLNHGHLHLGQILMGDHRLTLLDFQSLALQDSAHAFETKRQSCLHDYVAIFISLQFAWALSTHGPDSMVFRDILDRNSEYGTYFYEKTSEKAPHTNPEISLENLQSALSKSYFRALKDDPLTSELFPPSGADFEVLLKVYLFARCLKEILLNAEPGNPKAVVALQLLTKLEAEPWNQV